MQTDRLVCSDSIAVLLGAYALKGIDSDDRYQATSISHFMRQRQNWLKLDSSSKREIQQAMLKKINSLSLRDARAEFLRVAAMLPSYGATYFPVVNKKRSLIWLGVGPKGLMVHRGKYLPMDIFFSYQELGEMAVSDKYHCDVKLNLPKKSSQLLSFKTKAIKFNALTSRQAQSILQAFKIYKVLHELSSNLVSPITAFNEALKAKKKARVEKIERAKLLLIDFESWNEEIELEKLKYHPNYEVTRWLDPDLAPKSNDEECKCLSGFV